MNLSFKKLFLTAAFLLTLAAPCLAQSKLVGTVDMRRVFDKYWKRQEADAAIADHMAEFQKEFKAMYGEYTKTRSEYTNLVAQSNDMSTSKEEREKRKAAAETKLLEIQTAENALKSFDSRAADDMNSQKKRLKETLIQEVRSTVAAISKAAGYEIVLDTSAQTIDNTPIVLFSSNTIDLTDQVIKQLNASAPPPAADGKTPPDGKTPAGTKTDGKK